MVQLWMPVDIFILIFHRKIAEAQRNAKIFFAFLSELGAFAVKKKIGCQIHFMDSAYSDSLNTLTSFTHEKKSYKGQHAIEDQNFQPEFVATKPFL